MRNEYFRCDFHHSSTCCSSSYICVIRYNIFQSPGCSPSSSLLQFMSERQKVRERKKRKRERYWQRKREKETHDEQQKMEIHWNAYPKRRFRSLDDSYAFRLTSNWIHQEILHRLCYCIYGAFQFLKLRGERERDLFSFIAQIILMLLFSFTFDRLPSYEDDIPKALSVYDDLIAAEGPSATMIRASSFIPWFHPRTCHISESTTRREFDSHIEHIARFRVAHIIRISIKLFDVCNTLVNIEQTVWKFWAMVKFCN